MSGSLQKFQKIVAQTLNIGVFNRFQDMLVAVLAPILSNPILAGTLVTNVKLDNQKENYVNHGLGHAYQGYFIVRRFNSKGYTDIFESDVENKNPDKYVILNCLDKMTVSLWIF
jgi:hypothetical protein